MNISGIRMSSVFYDYNIIKNGELEGRQRESAEITENPVESARSGEQDAAASLTRPERGAQDYAKRYQPDATYELKGIDSDINSMDVERFISDMRRDQVLQQYQFFVGDNLAGTGMPENRINENFSL